VLQNFNLSRLWSLLLKSAMQRAMCALLNWGVHIENSSRARWHTLLQDTIQEMEKIWKDTAICPCPVPAWPYPRKKHYVVSLCALFPPSFSNMLSLKHVGESQLFCRMPQVKRPCSLCFSTQQDLSLSITNYLERLPWPSRSFLLKTEWMLNVCWARSFPRWERLRTKKSRPFQHVVVFAHRRAEDRLALFIWPAWHSIR
jgi:hypothetical protein